MEIANVRLRLNKFGSDVPLYDVTPAEAMFLHILHGPNNGGLSFGEEFSKIEVVGSAKVDSGKKKRVIVKEATPQKIVKGAMIKPAVPEQIIPGEVIKEAIPEKREKGKLLHAEVGKPGEPGFVPAKYEPDTITPAQTEVRSAGHKILAQAAQYAPDQIIPAEEAEVKDEPILVDRTDRQELMRLAKKYNQARNKENKPIIDSIWTDKLNPKLPQTFKDIDWKEVAEATAGIETATVNYVTGQIAKTS